MVDRDGAPGAPFKPRAALDRGVTEYTPPETVTVECAAGDTHPLRRVRDIGESAPARFGYPLGARYKYRGWCPDHGGLAAFRDGSGNWVPRPGSRTAREFEYVYEGE